MLITKYEDFYEGLAPFYDAITKVKDSHFSWLSVVERLLSGTNGNVLELGVGTGNLAIEMAQRGLTVTGIDVSEAMLKLAREKCSRFPSITLVKANAIDFATPVKFDMVISCGGPLIAIHENNSDDLPVVQSYLLESNDLWVMTENISRLMTDRAHFVIAVQNEKLISDSMDIGDGLSYSYLKTQLFDNSILKTHSVKMANEIMCEERYKLHCYEPCDFFSPSYLGELEFNHPLLQEHKQCLIFNRPQQPLPMKENCEFEQFAVL